MKMMFRNQVHPCWPQACAFNARHGWGMMWSEIHGNSGYFGIEDAFVSFNRSGESRYSSELWNNLLFTTAFL